MNTIGQLVAVSLIFYFVDETQGLVRRQQQSVEEEVATQRAVRQDVRYQAVADQYASKQNDVTARQVRK